MDALKQIRYFKISLPHCHNGRFEMHRNDDYYCKVFQGRKLHQM